MLKLFLTELMDSFLGHGLEGLPNAITVSGFVFSKSAVRKRKAADSDGVQLYLKWILTWIKSTTYADKLCNNEACVVCVPCDTLTG